jgi:hypothetical protein
MCFIGQGLQALVYTFGYPTLGVLLSGAPRPLTIVLNAITSSARASLLTFNRMFFVQRYARVHVRAYKYNI